jgi:hypothetical protein
MLKKIVLGIIIGAVVLTVGAGSIYAYQKNPDTADGSTRINNRLRESDCENPNSSENRNQYRLQQEEPGGLNCPNENRFKNECDNENCTEQYQNRENNCYMRNNEETGDQIQNNFSYRHENENKSSDKSCEQNCEINERGVINNINSKGYGRNK